MRKLTNEYVRAYVKAHFEHMFIEEDKDYFHIKTKMLQFHQSVLHSMGYETFINEDMSLRVTKIKEEPQPIIELPGFNEDYHQVGTAIEITLNTIQGTPKSHALITQVHHDKLFVMTHMGNELPIHLKQIQDGDITIRRLS